MAEREPAYLRRLCTARFLNTQISRNAFKYPNRCRSPVAFLIAKRPALDGPYMACSADVGEAPGCNLELPGKVAAARPSSALVRGEDPVPPAWDGTGLAMPKEQEDANE